MVGLHRVNRAKLEPHFSESPSLYGYGCELTRKEVYFEIWKTEVRQRPLQSDGKHFTVVKDRYRGPDGSQLVLAPVPAVLLNCNPRIPVKCRVFPQGSIITPVQELKMTSIPDCLTSFDLHTCTSASEGLIYDFSLIL